MKVIDTVWLSPGFNALVLVKFLAPWLVLSMLDLGDIKLVLFLFLRVHRYFLLLQWLYIYYLSSVFSHLDECRICKTITEGIGKTGLPDVTRNNDNQH